MSNNLFLWNAHWLTCGGGERYALQILESARRSGYRCFVLGLSENPDDLLVSRLRLGFQSAQYIKIAGEEDIAKIVRRDDIFINASYGSELIAPTERSVYVCHFPHQLQPSISYKSAIRKLIKAILFSSISQKDGISYLSLSQQVLKKFFMKSYFPKSYTQIWANSEFTQEYISKYWMVDSEINYPPVSRFELPNGLIREPKRILSVGRFMKPGVGHSKNQLKLVKAFKKVVGKQNDDQWELILIGGLGDRNRDIAYLDSIYKESQGFRVKVIPNASSSELLNYYATSSYFWHGTGIGVSKRKPQFFEHFGISVVEAIYSGLVPIPFLAGGIPEILGDLADLGYRSISELPEKQLNLLGENLSTIIERLHNNCLKFDDENFIIRSSILIKRLGSNDAL